MSAKTPKHEIEACGPGQPSSLGPEAWSEFLSLELETQVEVIFTRARRTVLRVEPHGLRRTLRMNAFFAHAPADVRGAVVSWIRSGRRARRKLELLDLWVEAQIELMERSAPRKLKLVSAGRVYDLEALALDLRENDFAGEFAAQATTASEAQMPAKWPQLTWGRAPKSRTRRTLRLGSFDYWTGLVRMHPVLDQTAVPEFFVRYVLFHELLHAALPAERGAKGRRIFHSREFRRREREYSGTAAALAWEKAHLQELLWSARTGNEMRTPKLVTRKIAAHETPPAEIEKPGFVKSFVQRWLFS